MKRIAAMLITAGLILPVHADEVAEQCLLTLRLVKENNQVRLKFEEIKHGNEARCSSRQMNRAHKRFREVTMNIPVKYEYTVLESGRSQWALRE